MKFLADENFDNTIVRGLIRRKPDIDIIRVQDVGLSGEDDPIVLEWAAEEDRILLTHDVATITRYAYQGKRISKSIDNRVLRHHHVEINNQREQSAYSYYP